MEDLVFGSKKLQEIDLDEYNAANPKKTTFMEGIEASFDLALSNEYGESFTRSLMQQEIASGLGGKHLNKQEAGKYPYLKNIPDEGMSEQRAFYLNDLEEQREKLRKVKRDAWGDGAFAFIADLPASIAGSLTDPAELAVNVATGWGVGAAAKKLFGKALATSTAAKVGTEIAENTLGSVAIEIPNYGLQRDLNKNYEKDDAFLNAAMGSFGFTAFKYSLKGAVKAVKGGYGKISSKLKFADLDENQSKIKNSIVPDNVHQKQALEEVTVKSNKAPDFAPGYTHTEWSVESQKKLFMTVDTTNSEVASFGIPAPDGMTFLSTSPTINNRLANGKFTEGSAAVHQVDLSEAVILDADTPIIDLDKEAFNTINTSEDPDLIPKFKQEIDESATFGDLIEKVREGIDSGKYTDSDLELIMSKVKDSGYDGVKMTFDKVDEKYHGVYLFDEAKHKAKSTGSFKPDKSAHADLSKKYKEQAQNKFESSSGLDDYSPKTKAEIDSVKDYRVPSDDDVSSEVEKIHKEQMEFLDSQAKAENLSGKDLELYERLKEDFANEETEFKAAQALKDCLKASA